MKNDYTPKIGDRIKWRGTASYSSVNLTGTILKISDAGFITSSVDGNDKKQIHRPSKYGRRYGFDLITAEEIRRFDWIAARPRELAYFSISKRFYSDEYEVRTLDQREGLDAAMLRGIAVEAELVAVWLDKEPK